MHECQTACFAAMGPLHNDQSHNTVEPLNKQATGTIKKQLPLNHFSTKVSTLLVLSLTPPSAPPPPLALALPFMSISQKNRLNN